MKQNKVDYITLCAQEKTIPIFMQSWWLDAVCTEGGKTWDVALARDKNGEIVAALAYVIRKKGFFKIITVPHLTKFTGVWQRPISEKLEHDKYNQEQSRLKSIISQLPDFHHLTLNLNTNLLDWSPFYWADFKQVTRYVQVLEDLSNKEVLFKNLNRGTKRSIKKAEEHFTIEIREDFDLFLKLHNQVFERQNIPNPTPLSIWQNLESILKEKKQRRMFFALDTEGVAQGAFYMIWDNQTAYGLASGLTETGRINGAMSYVTWRAINDASDLRLSFNFLGSMIPSISSFLQGFNTVKTPYNVLRKSKNWYYNTLFAIFK